MSAARPAAVSPPAPHGGELVERLVPADQAEALASEAARLPAVRLDGRGLADLECLAVGAFSPLTGFLAAADHAAVVEHGRLADGRVWTLPVVLPVPAETLAGAPERLALCDRTGTALAVLEVQEVYDPDPVTEAKHVFEHAFFCRRCDGMATSRTCPHQPASRLHLSGTAVRALLERGELPPPELSRPEVARVLVDGYRATSKG